MDELDYKKLFAKHWFADKKRPLVAAQKVFGEDIQNAFKYCELWQTDTEVLEEMRLLESQCTIEQIVATRVESAKLAWELANNDWLKGIERVKALELFAKMAGHIADTTVNKNVKVEETTVVKNVMLVKDHGSIEEWEQAILDQQARLTNEA